jgi:hypothetical protein
LYSYACWKLKNAYRGIFFRKVAYTRCDVALFEEQMDFIRLHGIVSQEIVVPIDEAVRT